MENVGLVLLEVIRIYKYGIIIMQCMSLQVSSHIHVKPTLFVIENVDERIKFTQANEIFPNNGRFPSCRPQQHTYYHLLFFRTLSSLKYEKYFQWSCYSRYFPRTFLFVKEPTRSNKHTSNLVKCN